MDQRLSYELIISEKLESLPIPDMADQVWLRIKDQLDLDMPTDDNEPEGPAGGGSPSIRGLVWTGLSILFITALVAIFYYRNPSTNNIPAKEIINSSAPAPAIIEKDQEPPDKIPLANPANTIAPVILPKDQPAFQNDDIVTIDSAAFQPAPGDVLSNPVTVAPPVTVQPAITDSSTVQKKKRGVQGIKDSDYRIIPKKQE